MHPGAYVVAHGHFESLVGRQAPRVAAQRGEAGLDGRAQCHMASRKLPFQTFQRAEVAKCKRHVVALFVAVRLLVQFGVEQPGPVQRLTAGLYVAAVHLRAVFARRRAVKSGETPVGVAFEVQRQRRRAQGLELVSGRPFYLGGRIGRKRQMVVGENALWFGTVDFHAPHRAVHGHEAVVVLTEIYAVGHMRLR